MGAALVGNNFSLFKSVTDAKFEPSEVTFLRLMPRTTLSLSPRDFKRFFPSFSLALSGRCSQNSIFLDLEKILRGLHL